MLIKMSLRVAKQRSNHKGFSLLELMVAVGILALAILGLFQAYSVSFMGMAVARDRTVATNYARETMEDIKNIPFIEIDDYIVGNDGSTKKISGKVFIINIESEAYEGYVDLKKVTTTVSWEEEKHKVKLETLICNSD